MLNTKKRVLSLILALAFVVTAPLSSIATNTTLNDLSPENEIVKVLTEIDDLDLSDGDFAQEDAEGNPEFAEPGYSFSPEITVTEFAGEAGVTYLEFSTDISEEDMINLSEIPDEAIIYAPSSEVPTSRITAQMPDPTYAITSTLTTENPMDIILFSLNSSKTLLFRPVSSNTNYVIELYFANMSTGVLTPSGAGAYFVSSNSSNPLIISGVPAGDYAWVVRSAGSVGASYSLSVNATLSGSFSDYYVAFDSTLSEIYTVNSNGVYSVNGTALSLDLKYEVNQFWGSGWHHRKTFLENVSYDNTMLYGRGSFSYIDGSTLHQYDDVLIFKVLPGAKWTSLYDVSPHYGYTPIYMGSYDMRGKFTPRVLEASDVSFNEPLLENGSYCGYLIYDMKQKKSVEFLSALNYHFMDDVNFYHTIRLSVRQLSFVS